MTGAGSMMAVFYVRSCVMVELVVSGRVCDGGGGVASQHRALVGQLVSVL